MNEPSHFIDEVGELAEELNASGVTPILVGGMALVILGSQRVTKDFDFVIAQEARDQKQLLDILYKRGFELAARLNDRGEITVTIDNKNVAGARLKIDRPSSAYFLNRKTGLRIDFLFDFPLAADELQKKAQKIKVRSHTLLVASTEDLLRLKEIACKKRSVATDKQDLEFLLHYSPD